MKISVRLTVLAALAASALTASAATLRFDRHPGLIPGQEMQGIGNDIFLKGYRLAYVAAPGEPYPVGFTAVDKSWRFNGRSVAIVANSCGATTTLTRDDNNPFSAEAIDLAPLNGDEKVRVRFRGVTPEGQQVEHVVSNKAARWRTVDFPREFESLNSLTWWQGDCVANPPHMFDNIRVGTARRHKH